MLNGLLYLHGLSRTSAKVYIQLIGLKGSNRKYKRDDKMRALLPSDKSVPFLLVSVAMEETETAYRGKYINGNSGDKPKSVIRISHCYTTLRNPNDRFGFIAFIRRF